MALSGTFQLGREALSVESYVSGILGILRIPRFLMEAPAARGTAGTPTEGAVLHGWCPGWCTRVVHMVYTWWVHMVV